MNPVAIKLTESPDRSYRIYFQSHTDLPTLMQESGLPPSKLGLVTDDNVAPHYLAAIENALSEAGYSVRSEILPAGETTKSLENLSRLFDRFLGFVNRKTPLIALGGGVIGDLTGFAAASLLRGVPFIQVPTTLMAQVDSSIGGKTGINHAVGKNLLGAFHQPKLVLCDFEALKSLPVREWYSGLAEVVKHAFIYDDRLFDDLKTHWDAVLNRNFDVIAPIIRRSVEIKGEVVMADETEQNLRAILNFGHTFGHAIEQVTGYQTLLHGEAVIHGMVAALHLSRALKPDFDPQPALDLLAKVPVSPLPAGLSEDDLMTAMQSDKKADATSIRFIVLNLIRAANIVRNVPESLLRAAWQTIL